MYNLMVNKERKVLLPTAYQEPVQPYEEVYSKISEEFSHEVEKYSVNGDVMEFRMSLMNYIDSLVDLCEEM